ncbi:hypothetical protein EYF80_029236 [Liparis tanakae]|uniref:Uncharacterized protein n=1 Tax=Liparis tanakae TaxID=230148 RepID=A0A4Z2H683_9TELE|nr:hypothetical protein EYF80_029236 [Liparis tanakae]
MDRELKEKRSKESSGSRGQRKEMGGDREPHCKERCREASRTQGDTITLASCFTESTASPSE